MFNLPNEILILRAHPHQLMDLLVLLSRPFLLLHCGDIGIRCAACDKMSVLVQARQTQANATTKSLGVTSLVAGKAYHTSSSVVGHLLRPEGRRLNILTFARNLRTVRIIMSHISRATATSCVDFLFDCGGDEVFVRWG